MDLSGEVAIYHMRFDAKNLVTTAITTHLPDQKETTYVDGEKYFQSKHHQGPHRRDR